MGGPKNFGSADLHAARFGAVTTRVAAGRLPYGLRHVQRLAAESLNAGTIFPSLSDYHLIEIKKEGPKTLLWFFDGDKPVNPGTLDFTRIKV